MRVLVTSDRGHYRRWVSALVTFLIPGSAQSLSGARQVGAVWFVLGLVLGVVEFALLPRSPAPAPDRPARPLPPAFRLDSRERSHTMVV